MNAILCNKTTDDSILINVSYCILTHSIFHKSPMDNFFQIYNRVNFSRHQIPSRRESLFLEFESINRHS